MRYRALPVGRGTWMELLPAIRVSGKHRQWRSAGPLVPNDSLSSGEFSRFFNHFYVVPFVKQLFRWLKVVS